MISKFWEKGILQPTKFERAIDLFIGFMRKTTESLIPDWFSKPMIRFIKRTKKNCSIGVEIGVAEGHNSKNILLMLPVRKLYLVDSYFMSYKEENRIVEYPENTYVKAKKRLSKFDDRIIWVFKKSEDAIDEIPNNLDFVYIDGNHSYDFVKKDIENYYPKVRKGGIIGGHDFSGNHIDVSKAVIDFATEKQLKICGRDDDWWIEKS